ncbi:MAG: preprotein translocase subunit SecE [Bacteroidales bacterium]|jgi:preprotein translocase SecE subunit|nr:preprotein translocase subunit SecE [Bacteroidales bacterium]
MENIQNVQEPDKKSNTSYVRVMLIFVAVMTVLLLGINYLFQHIFNTL